MMKAHNRMAPLAILVVGATLASAGCSDRYSTETTSQKVERNAEKVAAATERATSQAANAVEDAAITAKVKSAIIAEPGLSALRIDVDTKDGVVTMSGVVESATLKERATQTAQQVSGVRSVIDNLAVKSTG
jgi:osmotically-inducible protein OsmY